MNFPKVFSTAAYWAQVQIELLHLRSFKPKSRLGTGDPAVAEKAAYQTGLDTSRLKSAQSQACNRQHNDTGSNIKRR